MCILEPGDKSVRQAAMRLIIPHVHSPHFNDVYYNEEPHAIRVQQFLHYAQKPPTLWIGKEQNQVGNLSKHMTLCYNSEKEYSSLKE